MGAVESLEGCCTERTGPMMGTKGSDAMLDPKIPTTTRLTKMFAEPLGDLRLDKAIDAEVAGVFLQLGRKLPSPIEGPKELESLLETLREKGYNFGDDDEQVCKKIWIFCKTSRRRITTKQFRSWFHGEVFGSKDNLRILLNSSRYVQKMVSRTEEDAKSSLGLSQLCEVMKSLHHHLGEPLPCETEMKAVALQMVPWRSDTDSLGREEFMRVLVEMLVHLYFDNFKRQKNADLNAKHAENADLAAVFLVNRTSNCSSSSSNASSTTASSSESSRGSWKSKDSSSSSVHKAATSRFAVAAWTHIDGRIHDESLLTRLPLGGSSDR